MATSPQGSGALDPLAALGRARQHLSLAPPTAAGPNPARPPPGHPNTAARQLSAALPWCVLERIVYSCPRDSSVPPSERVRCGPRAITASRRAAFLEAHRAMGAAHARARSIGCRGFVALRF